MHRRRQEEDDKEERKVEEYREIGMRLKDYPEDEVRKARQLVSSFIKSAEEVEEVMFGYCIRSYSPLSDLISSNQNSSQGGAIVWLLSPLIILNILTT